MKRFYLAIMALFLWNQSMAADIEEPRWTLVDTVDEIELREYAPTVRAVTQLGDSGETTSGFRRLAGFIFGGNDSGQKIAMTAPVEETLNTDAPMMAFTMPSEYKMEDLPDPEDKAVTLEEMPGRTMAAIRFSGWATNGKVNKKTEELMQTLARNGIDTVGNPSLNQYNPPWTPPFLRRNEIMIQVELPQAGS